jgi:hypothetical protein
MKTLRLLLVLSIALTLIAVAGPVQAQDGSVDGESSGVTCGHYATIMNGTRDVFSTPYVWNGAGGPFSQGIYTFDVTATGGSATFRIVAEPSGATTIAGPFTTPATVSVTMGATGQPHGMGLLIDSIAPGPQQEGVRVTVAISCGVAGCDAQVNIPPQAVVGSFVAPAAVYFAPGQLITNPPLTIEAGKTYWVAGQDATGMYRKVLLSCQWVWVLRDTVGPNYDSVWQGKPLPTDVVN